jgi:hypothetical protein
MQGMDARCALERRSRERDRRSTIRGQLHENKACTTTSNILMLVLIAGIAHELATLIRYVKIAFANGLGRTVRSWVCLPGTVDDSDREHTIVAATMARNV